ncbi:MAG: hypothetical protein E7170_04690 [Firmicutes bacterium]|nr:hypothetical protein [Bacillota bacterium]
MENKKINPLVIFLLIVILVLCATVGFLLIYDKDSEDENKPGVNENNPGTNVDEPTNPSLQDISLDDTDVKNIVDKFGLTMDKHDPVWQMDLYIDSKLKDEEMMRITYHKIESAIKKEENCTEQLFDGYGYYCNYILYEDFNNEYKKLSGKDLPKTDLAVELYDLKYDSSKNIYRIYNVFAGGGTLMSIFSKLDKASKMGDYIYIYEKVAFIWPEDIVTLQKPHLYKHTDMGYEYSTDSITLGTYEQLEAYNNPSIILNSHIDKFDTYKWTFKKDLNGNYVYENLEYVAQ